MDNETAPLAELLRSLRDDTTTLVRKEAALAKTEISENLSRMARNAAYLAVGALVGFVALVMLFMGLAKLATLGFVALEMNPLLSEVLGYFVVAIIIAGAAAALVSKALQTIKENTIVPEKSIESLKEDKDWAKDKATS